MPNKILPCLEANKLNFWHSDLCRHDLVHVEQALGGFLGSY